MDSKIQTKAYKSGFNDFEYRVKLEDCPYDEGTIERLDYYRGWKDAYTFWYKNA
jgi:hypothetical protein